MPEASDAVLFSNEIMHMAPLFIGHNNNLLSEYEEAAHNHFFDGAEEGVLAHDYFVPSYRCMYTKSRPPLFANSKCNKRLDCINLSIHDSSFCYQD